MPLVEWQIRQERFGLNTEPPRFGNASATRKPGKLPVSAKRAALKEDETVVFSWILTTRASRDRINKA
jgi:hypothetical protein